MSQLQGPLTSPSLLAQLSCLGNAEAWETFVKVYVPFIDDCCRRAKLQTADMEEVRSRVLESLVKAMRSFTYDPEKRFRGYINQCVKNALRRYFRQLTRRPGSVGSGSPGIQEQLETVELPEPLTQMAGELDQCVQEGLRQTQTLLDVVRGQVEPETWQAFQLTMFGGRSAAEVARELGKSVGAVYMAKSRVLGMLRARAKQAAQENPIS